MGILETKMKNQERYEKPKPREEKNIPQYDSRGRVIKTGPNRKKKVTLLVICLIAVYLAIYIPSWIYKEQGVENVPFTEADASAIGKLKQYVQSHGSGDLDGDGLINQMELEYGTSPRRPDTDGDGVCDYAELYLVSTDPKVRDITLETEMQKQLEKEGKTERIPFKQGNVIMWADNLYSRAHGAVVQTTLGYRFCNYTGWAQFSNETVYAYKIVNGRHIPLRYREDGTNSWYIDDESEVVLLNEPLETVYEFRCVGVGVKYLSDGFFGKVLSFLLPEHSYFMSCEKVMKEDTFVDTTPRITNPIVEISYDYNDESRFGRSYTQLSDLRDIYGQLEQGRCILISLISGSKGETLIEVYGFNENGDLYYADPVTKEPIGTLYIEERAAQYMDANGKISERTWYEFSGAGYDSKANGDMLSVVGTSLKEKLKTEKEEPKANPVLKEPVEEESSRPNILEYETSKPSGSTENSGDQPARMTESSGSENSKTGVLEYETKPENSSPAQEETKPAQTESSENSH